MDLCSEMLRIQLQRVPDLQLAELCPPFQRRFGRIPILGRRGAAFNLDRLLNRFRDYPHHVRQFNNSFDCFHLCDHSYSQLLHELPLERSGVFCHDLDTFRCLLNPQLEPRPSWFRRMVRRTLDGFCKAQLVFYSTKGIRQQILDHGLIEPQRLLHAPYGTSPEYHPRSTELDGEPLSGLTTQRFLIHVGSCIPRKRIDVLLRVFAEVRRHEPELLLVQVGGEWTTDQQKLIDELTLHDSIRQVRGVTRQTIAALLRRAEMLLLTSEAEGFGIPLIEGLACGATVLASDIQVLRGVGGDAAIYAPVAAIGTWSETVLGLLGGTIQPPDRQVKLARAGLYTWESHATTILNAYRRMLNR